MEAIASASFLPDQIIGGKARRGFAPTDWDCAVNELGCKAIQGAS
jgi:hypothetical protein